jgi:hypothetical protein
MGSEFLDAMVSLFQCSESCFSCLPQISGFQTRHAYICWMFGPLHSGLNPGLQWRGTILTRLGHVAHLRRSFQRWKEFEGIACKVVNLYRGKRPSFSVAHHNIAALIAFLECNSWTSYIKLGTASECSLDSAMGRAAIHHRFGNPFHSISSRTALEASAPVRPGTAAMSAHCYRPLANSIINRIYRGVPQEAFRSGETAVETSPTF